MFEAFENGIPNVRDGGKEAWKWRVREEQSGQSGPWDTLHRIETFANGIPNVRKCGSKTALSFEQGYFPWEQRFRFHLKACL